MSECEVGATWPLKVQSPAFSGSRFPYMLESLDSRDLTDIFYGNIIRIKTALGMVLIA
jgi:hypothetical protein